jgi:hypothetical protein
MKVDGTNGLLQSYDYQVLTTGFSYTFAAGTQTLVINPAGTLATGTITMPASPVDGMTITFSSTKEISTLTVNANSGQSIVGTPGVLPANNGMTFVYRSANTTWYSTTASVNGTNCRAWVNFNGSGTVAIRASFNVSSITDNGTGDYTMNFTTAMADANYSTVGMCGTVASNYGTLNFYNAGNVVATTTAIRFSTVNSSFAQFDHTNICLSVFR